MAGRDDKFKYQSETIMMLGIFNPYWCVYPVCWIQ